MSEPFELDRDETVDKLKQLKGQDLSPLAKEFGVFYSKKTGRINKHWVEDTLAVFLGLPAESLRNDIWVQEDKSARVTVKPPKLKEQDANPENYRIIVGWSTLEQHFVAWIPELPGVACGGDTQEQAIKGLRLVRDMRLKSLRETGRPIPRPMYVRITS